MIHVFRIAVGLGCLLAVGLVVALFEWLEYRFEWLEYRFPRVMDMIGNAFLVLLVIASFSALAYFIGGAFL